jgi:hypothetical protein
MSNFRAMDRETGFLLPPSVDEWLLETSREAPGALCRGVIEGLDLSAMARSYRGSGSASYHPAVRLSVLAYGYATGVFSSRKLEYGADGDGLAISTRCRFIALVLQAGRIEAAPLPSFGQTAPKM